MLPATPRTREQFQWLAVEVEERGGEALVWEGQLVLNGQAERLVAQFQAQADAQYQALMVELAEPEADLTALSRRFQQISGQDYFPTALGRQARQALLAARGGVEP